MTEQGGLRDPSQAFSAEAMRMTEDGVMVFGLGAVRRRGLATGASMAGACASESKRCLSSQPTGRNG